MNNDIVKENQINPSEKRYKCLSSNAIKLIAIIAMTIDHIAWAVFSTYSTNPLAIIMHIIGRLTMPIMWYCIAEGYHYTHDVKKYTRRLFIFAAISHIPYMLQSEPFKEFGYLALIPFATGNGIMGHVLNQTSVMLSLAIGLVMLRVNDNEKLPHIAKTIIILLLYVVSFPADGSCIGSLCVLTIGTNRGKPIKQIICCAIYVLMYVAIYFFFINKVYALIQLCYCLAIPFIICYNGKRGKNKTVNKVFKYGFYIYYPLHLLIIGLLNILLK